MGGTEDSRSGAVLAGLSISELNPAVLNSEAMFFASSDMMRMLSIMHHSGW
jgi:hypothetical protein